MRNMKVLCSLVLLALISISSTALADRGHGHGGRSHIGVGLYFGAPYPYHYYPYPYYAYPYYPYPYYPPVTVAPSQPPVYIERGDQAPAATDDYYWYHCDKPEGYYPYIKDCPGGWQKVTPTPPP